MSLNKEQMLDEIESRPLKNKVSTELEVLMLKCQKYLVEYLKTTTRLNDVDRAELIKIGKTALEEKKFDVELENSDVPKNLRKREPTKLTPLETAAILCNFFKFINIKTAKQKLKSKLGRYCKTGENEGIYLIDEESIYVSIRDVSPEFTVGECKEVISQIKSNVETKLLSNKKNLVPVANGVFDKNEKKLKSFSEDYVFLTKVKVSYRENVVNKMIEMPDGEFWDIETWLKELIDNDEDIYTLLWQVIADSIQTSYSRGKAIFFYSKTGNSGKGTFGQIIKNLLGNGNYSTLNISDFNVKFLLANLVGTGVNIADENNVDQYIDSVSSFKASITGDDIIIDQKYEQPFSFKYSGTNIQMINALPKTKDKTGSFYRRIIMVPFVKSFTNNGERKYIKEDYIYDPEVLEYILNKALHLEFEEFIEPAVSKELLLEYKEFNNPVIQFWDEFNEQFVWDRIPNSFLYDLFVTWIRRTNPSGKPFGKKQFNELLKEILESEDGWEFKQGPVSTGNSMDDDEPLITDYKLIEWYDPSYNGNKSYVLRNFTRKKQYRDMLVRL